MTSIFGRNKTKDSNSSGTPSKTLEASASMTSKLSKTEQDATKRLFTLMVTCPRLLSVMEKHSGSSADELPRSLISLSQATGTTFEMIRFFIAEDFRRHADTDSGSIMRGNCIASKLTKELLKRIGRPYLATLLSGPVNTLIDENASFEIDPLRVEDNANKTDENVVITANKSRLVDAVKLLVTSITSPENVEKLPVEVRVLASYFGEFAYKYAPDQFYPLVGGFLMLRWINPAITNPDAYGIVPESRMNTNMRRNLVLATKVLQNLSNGVEFTNKENYMMTVNEFIKVNFWRMEKYLRGVVSPVSAPKIIGIFFAEFSLSFFLIFLYLLLISVVQI